MASKNPSGPVMDEPAGARTHFGYQEVNTKEKAGLVGAVFSSVAGRYDIMNDLMSFGAHRLWKQFAVSQSGLREGGNALDLAAGSGDLARLLARRVGRTGTVTMADINHDMLKVGKARMMDEGLVGNIDYVLADAERPALRDSRFDCVSISFGLRNVTRKDEALRSMYRALKPGGRALILEFSRPVIPLLEKVYDRYSFSVIPQIGKYVAGDEDSYQYLVESIRMHPDQDTLAAMMREAGFEDVRHHNLSGGIVSLHIGFRYNDLCQ